MLVEVPKMKMITPSILSDRLRINGSLARATLKHLEAEGKIRAIYLHLEGGCLKQKRRRKTHWMLVRDGTRSIMFLLTPKYERGITFITT